MTVVPVGAAVPALSVVIVVFAGAEYLRRCLDALAAGQVDATKGRVEVIVAHERGVVDALARDHVSLAADGALDIHHVRGDAGCGPARLRALGAAAARGSVIAFTEDHCLPAGDWCLTILAAHERESAVIGGAIEKVPDDTGLNWAGYLLTYARYMPPLAPGAAPYLSDCNVSYRRTHLDLVQDTWLTDFHETSVNWALKARGIALILEPAMLVRQQRTLAWRSAMREQLEHGSIFARTRTAGMPLPRRIALIALSPALPAVMVARTIRRARASGGSVPLVRSLPGLVALATAWAVGELRGYLRSDKRA